jgi:SAM-dependent methyltransferase
MASTPLDDLLNGLRAAAEPSRLRLLAICSHGEWTVSELVQVMAQSQPRISRHLKLLAEAGLLERFREGGWVFYRRTQTGDAARIARSLCRLLPEGDPMLALDRQRLAAIRATRRRQAERFFDERAAVWDSETDVAVEAGAVEQELLRIFGTERCHSLVDVGTGTGRILQVLAGQIGSGLGIDLSHDMLRVARANLDRREARNCQVRYGDMYQLPLADAAVHAVTLHQVLHFADDPQAALAEAARVLMPGGRLVVVDLAQHDLEWLRTDKGHRRLGFAPGEVAGWFAELGLDPAPVTRLEGEGADVCIWLARKAMRDDGRRDTATIEPETERAA